MTAKANIGLQISASEQGANAFSDGPHWGGSISLMEALISGTVAGKFDLLYMAERTIASNTNDDIDVAGALTSALGVSFAAAELVLFAAINAPKDPDAAANTTNLTIGGATAFVPGYEDARVPISPGGFMCDFSPGAAGLATVVATTADKIRIANSAGASAKVQVAIFGRTA